MAFVAHVDLAAYRNAFIIKLAEFAVVIIENAFMGAGLEQRAILAEVYPDGVLALVVGKRAVVY